MTREELLNSKEYWIAGMQISIFEAVSQYMEENNLTENELALRLNCNQRMASEILAGDFSGTINEFVSILLMCGKVPLLSVHELNSSDIEEKIKEIKHKVDENN